MALIVGIDLGRKSAHDVVILRRQTALQVGRSFRFTTTPQGLERLFEQIEMVREDHEAVDFVIDSPGRAWIPIAAVLKRGGYRVYRPSAVRLRRLRQAGHGKNKSNRIDALTLARCLLNYPQDTARVFLPQGTLAQLDQLVRHRDRTVDSLRRRKQRIQDLCEAVNPGLVAAAGGLLLSQPGRALLRSYLDPTAVVRLGQKRLAQFLQKRYRLTLQPETAQEIFAACQQATQLYQPVRNAQQMPFDVAILQEEMNWELEQLEREEDRVHHLEAQIKKLNKQLDPCNALVSLPGIGQILAAGIRTCVGDIGRFDCLNKHRGFAGLYPVVKKTGDKQSAAMSISKMSCNRYKRYLFLAAENAYKWDLEMAAFYHKRREGGHTHTQAVCAVANAKLLSRIHHLLKQLKAVEGTTRPRPHYVFKDLSGHPISKAEARAIIQARWRKTAHTKKSLAIA
jgi:transposase